MANHLYGWRGEIAPPARLSKINIGRKAGIAQISIGMIADKRSNALAVYQATADYFVKKLMKK